MTARIPLAGLALLLGSACVAVVADEPRRGGSYYACNVPPGHLPPPGECRIWHPDLPPGQQSPPGDCYELRRRVPPDACLVHGD